MTLGFTGKIMGPPTNNCEIEIQIAIQADRYHTANTLPFVFRIRPQVVVVSSDY